MNNTLVIECACVPSSPFYLRWLNKYAGWDYWMFQKRQLYERSQKDVDTYKPYIADYAVASGTDKLLDKSVEDRVTVGAEQLKNADWTVVAGVMDSSFVQWYDKGHERWVDVVVDKTKVQRQTDDGLHSLEFTLLLPGVQLAI